MSLYKRLYDQHRLNMRVRATFGLKHTDRPAEKLIREAIEFRARWSIDPDFLRADAVKIFADGVIEYPSQTAALLEPYLDAQGRPTQNRGPTYYSQAHLNDVVSAANAASFTVHIHAIGDRAVRSALNAFAESRRRNGVLDNARSDRPSGTYQPAGLPALQGARRDREFPIALGRTRSLHRRRDAALSWARALEYLYPARSLLDAGALIAGAATGASAVSMRSKRWSTASRAARRAATSRSSPSKAFRLRPWSTPTRSTPPSPSSRSARPAV